VAGCLTAIDEKTFVKMAYLLQELSTKWPKSYWDDWMRQPTQRRDRACIRPEIGRTKTFGEEWTWYQRWAAAWPII